MDLCGLLCLTLVLKSVYFVRIFYLHACVMCSISCSCAEQEFEMSLFRMHVTLETLFTAAHFVSVCLQGFTSTADDTASSTKHKLDQDILENGKLC